MWKFGMYFAGCRCKKKIFLLFYPKTADAISTADEVIATQRRRYEKLLLVLIQKNSN